MRTLQEAFESVETYSPAEELFNRRRRTAGLFLGPMVFGLVLWLPLGGLSPEAHRMAAIMALVMVLWVSEALPMAAVALLGPLLAILLGVAKARVAFASFADPIIFLFIGSFMLAEAMFVHGVDRRIAYSALSWRAVGTSGPRILIVYGGVATALSMWISNTATTAMMFPIGMSIVAHMAKASRRGAGDIRRFATAMMLITAFGASVGGMGTPVGTPPNLIGIGLIERIHGRHIGFFEWMAIGIPLVLVLAAFLAVFLWLTCARGVRAGEGSAALVRDELRKLGPMSAGQRNVIVAFGFTVILWILPGVLAVAGLGDSAFARRYADTVPESVAAMTGAMLLFLLPISWRARRFTLTWDEAVRIDWGIILLYGGGLALGELAFSTGLAKATGDALMAWVPSHSEFALTALFTGLAILLSEATSNTASANMIVPVAIALSQSAGVNSLLPALGATLGASMGFMMPISTAPNAIVYSSGHIPITSMMKYGLALDIAGFVAIVALLTLLGPLVF
jgi:sodium-dependent dicarboxylate transporter 2/3/5